MRTLTAVLALVLVLAARLAPFASAAPYHVTDALGRTVAFGAVPSRIVVAGRGTLILVDSVYLFPGVGDRIVGVAVTDQGLGDVLPVLDPSYASKVRFPNNAGAEQIAGARPDLVILKTYSKQGVGDALERAGIPVLYLDLETPRSFFADVRTLGALFQQPERAATIVRWYEARVAAVSAAVGASAGTGAVATGRPRVLVVQATAKDAELAVTVPPAGWIQAWMVETAGGTPVWVAQNLTTGWLKVGVEQVASWDPEHLFVVSYASSAAEAARRLAISPAWQAIPAGRADAIRPFPADLASWDQSDARWILGLAWLAATLHPDRFPGFDLRAETTAFYRQMYALDEAAIESQILPRLPPAAAGR
jgi:iron complex transport system substrate-binding protein